MALKPTLRLRCASGLTAIPIHRQNHLSGEGYRLKLKPGNRRLHKLADTTTISFLNPFNPFNPWLKNLYAARGFFGASCLE